MKLTGARGIGLLWGAVAATLVAAAPAAPAVVSGLPACVFKAVFGLPCPTCGGSRVALALSRLDLGNAFRMNPLVTVGIVGLVGGGLLAAALALAGRPIPEPNRYPVWLRAALVLALAANWTWLVFDKR